MTKLASGNEARPSADGPWVADGLHTDDRILATLRENLRRKAGVDLAYCDMEVRDRVVYLRGSVASLDQKRALAGAAKEAPGVRAIVNGLRITPLIPRSDDEVLAHVQEALLKQPKLTHQIKVAVKDGVVYLEGDVSSIEERYAAEDAAWSVHGVRDVINNVSPSAAVCPRPDQELLRDIQLCLRRCLDLDPANIQVEVVDGIAYLRGQVSSAFEKFLAEDTVRWIPCIVDVVNDLIVTPKKPTAHSN
jgi:osmotically-inducible protein OsmY